MIVGGMWVVGDQNVDPLHRFETLKEYKTNYFVFQNQLWPKNFEWIKSPSIQPLVCWFVLHMRFSSSFNQDWMKLHRGRRWTIELLIVLV